MADELRLQVRAPESGNDFEVLVFVNGVEMTSIGAGMGMDPYDLFVPFNRLRPRAESFEVPIARCNCGIYGCGSTDVRITLDGDEVHWDWLIEKPSEQRATVRRDEYDSALRALDRSTDWETPERTAGRLVLSRLDKAHLARFDLRPGFVCNDWREPSLFQVVLTYRDTHQVFLRFPWNNATPGALARTVVDVLTEEPSTWTGTRHQFEQRGRRPPKFAERWEQERL